jgi:hypothetical protein
MKKKVRYSKTLEHFWDVYHKNYAKLGLDSKSLYIRMKLDINRQFPPKTMPVENQSEILGTELWYKDFNEEVTHLYFIDRNLKQFLGDTKLSDLNGIKKFLRKSGEEEDVSIINTKSIEKILMYNFSIHIPYEKEGFAFSLGLDEESKLTLLFCKGETLSTISEDYYRILEKSEDKIEKFNAFAFRLAVNILAYLSCFPECIKDGVPDNFNDKIENINNKIISLSDKVIEIKKQNENGKKVTPHFRKGFFRVLKSDFYKNKKGEIIFVHETMVNAKAKTIHSTEELDRLK